MFGFMTIAVVFSLGMAVTTIATDGIWAWWFGLGNVDVAIVGMWIWAFFGWRLSDSRYFPFRCALGVLLALAMLLDLAAWFRVQYSSTGPVMQFGHPIQSFLIMVMFLSMYCRRKFG